LTLPGRGAEGRIKPKENAMRDMMGLMKQAQAMQQKMQDVQAELDSLEVEGASGGGVVTVKVTGKGALKAIAIDPSLMVPDEKEILEDLIVAAMNDARVKAERTMQERMAEITKGLPLPPGMKLF
jgi:DNA-binding YbaB/EbfC family protein